mgnify:CR=1 FL=1
MTEVQRAEIQRITDKLLAANRESWEIKMAIQAYKDEQGISMDDASASTNTTKPVDKNLGSLEGYTQNSSGNWMDASGEVVLWKDQTAEAGWGSTVTGGDSNKALALATQLETQASMATDEAGAATTSNPDFWNTQSTDPKDWVVELDSSGRSVAYRNTTTNEVMRAGNLASTMWTSQQSDLWQELERNEELRQALEPSQPDQAQQEVNNYFSDNEIDRDEYTTSDVNGVPHVTFDGGNVLDEEDPTHGETVKMLKQEFLANKKKQDKKAKEDKDRAIQDVPTFEGALSEWAEKRENGEWGGSYARGKWLSDFKKNALQYGFRIEGTWNTNYPGRTRFTVEHLKTGEKIEVQDTAYLNTPDHVLRFADADAFILKNVEARATVVGTLTDAAELEIEGGAGERMAAAKNEVKDFKDIEEAYNNIDPANESAEALTLLDAQNRAARSIGLDNYADYKFSITSRSADVIVSPKDKEEFKRILRSLIPGDWSGDDAVDSLTPTAALRKNFEEGHGDAKKAEVNARKQIAFKRYIQQAGITDPKEIEEIRSTIFAPNFKLENLSQFEKRVETEDGFYNLNLDTLYNDRGTRDPEVIESVTAALHSDKNEEALIESISQQVRDMDYSALTKGDVQKSIAEEIKINQEDLVAKITEQHARAKIVNNRYVSNKDTLVANVDKRAAIIDELNAIADVKYKTQEEVDVAQGKIDKLKSAYDKLTEEIQKGKNTHDLLFNASIKIDGELRESGLEMDEIELYSKYVNQNFAPGTRMLTSGLMTAVTMGQSGVEFLGMVNDTFDEAQSWVLKGLGVGDETVEAWCAINDYIPGLGGVTTGPLLQKSTRNEFHSMVDNWKESVESGVGSGIAFNDISNAGDFGMWFGEMFSSQIPNLALMYATGGASLYVMGATSAGGKYKDIRAEDELFESTGGLYGNDYNFAQMFTTSMLTGTAEALSEKITLGQMKTAKGMWKGMTKEALKDTIKPGVGNYLIKNVISKQSLKRGFVDTLEEGGSEMAATMSENILSKYILGKEDINILDGVPESFVSGALISRTIGSFGMVGKAYSTFADPSTSTKKSAYISRLQTIAEALGSGEEKNSLISTSRKAELEKEIAEIQVEYDKLIEIDIQRVDMMDNSEKADMIKFTKAESRLQREYSETTDPDNKKRIEEEYRETKEAKQKIVDKYPPEDVKVAYAESMALAQAKAKLAREVGKQDITVKDGSLDEAIEFIKEMEAKGFKVDKSEVGPDGVMRGAKEGDFYGVTAEIIDPKTKKRTTVIFMNKDAVLAGGMVQTAAHEFMHATLYSTVMQDPGVREVLGRELLKIIKGPGIKISEKARLDLQRLDKYSPQEAGEELFAIVAENMLPDADGNIGITIDDTAVGRFKDMIRRIWQNKFGYDINFDTTDDVRLFMKNYARNARRKGKAGNAQDAAIEKMLSTAVNGKLIDEGKALKPGQRSTEKMKLDFSNARDGYIKKNPKQAKENKKRFDSLTQNEDGGKRWESKEEWEVSAEKWDGFSLLDNSNEFMDNLVMSGMSYGEGHIRGEQDKRDFIKEVKEELQDRYHGGLSKNARNKLDKIKERLNIKEITPLEAAEQIEAVENNKENYRVGFDPTIANGSLFGWIAGGAGQISDEGLVKSTLYHARGDVMKRWKADPNRGSLSLDAPIGEGGETFGSKLEATPDTGGSLDADIDPDSLTKVWEDLGLSEDTVKSIRTSISGSNIDIGKTAGFMGTKQETVGVNNVPVLKDGKPVLNKKGEPKTKTPSKVGDVKFSGRASGVLKAVANEFGVDHRKVPTGITLLPKERTAILNRLAADPTSILNNMPDQHTRGGKAVGVQGVLLNALFDEKGYRGGTKAATAVGDVGMSSQGIEIWKKKKGLDEVMLMEAFGVEGSMQDGKFVETGRFDPKSTKFDSVLKAAVSQVAALASNQQLRVQAIESQSHPTDVIAEFGDGKNELSFSKAGPTFKGDPALLYGLVDFMRANPNFKLNPEQAAIAYAEKESLTLEQKVEGLGNAVEFIQANIDAVYGDKPWEDPELASYFKQSSRTIETIEVAGWKEFFTKTGLPGDFNFDRTNPEHRARYEVQSREWLKTLPDEFLELNSKGTPKHTMVMTSLLTNNEGGAFHANAKAVAELVKQESRRREYQRISIPMPDGMSLDGVSFDDKLMNKIDAAIDGRLNELPNYLAKKVKAIQKKHKNIKNESERQDAIVGEVTQMLVENSSSDPAAVNKAFDFITEGWNSFANEPGLTEVEREERLRWVSTTLRDQTNRPGSIIKGAANFVAVSKTPGKTKYKGVQPSVKNKLIKDLGIEGTANDIQSIASLLVGAKAFPGGKKKARIDALQNRLDSAIAESLIKQGVKPTPAAIKKEILRLKEKHNTIKTRHGEHDIALMMMATTMFNSMRNNTFHTAMPVIKKYYTQTALNEDNRVEVDKAWGNTGNAPGYYMGMPGYIRFIVHDPRLAMDIFDMQAGATLDRVIAADIALGNLSSEYSNYAPIVVKARDILGKKGFEADWQSGGYNMIQFLQAERKKAPVESRFLHDKNIKEIKEALGIVKEISYFTENKLINNVRGDLTWEKMGRAMIKFLKAERKQAPVESRFLHDKNIEIIEKAMGIPSEISYFTEKKFNNFPKKSKDVVSQLPKILENIDTRVAFGGLIAEIAKSIYDGTDLVAAETMAIRLGNKASNIESINKLRDAIAAKQPGLVTPDMTVEDIMGTANMLSFSKPRTEGTKGISALDFDDTLATTNSKVLFTAPDGTTGKLTAEEFAKKGAELLEQGYVYDFSEFNKVIDGKTAPLFNKALKLAEKFGTKDMFVVTARNPQSAVAIKQFLDAQGLNIPLENITGLGNSTAQAKALWIAGKINEGYNDFYFADDVMQNVDAVKDMLDKHDVKGKVQQAKLSFSKTGPKKITDIISESESDNDLSTDLNTILEETKGVKKEKKFSPAKARQRGKNKGKWKFFVPPSAEDFAGLMYAFMGKGKKGDQHHNWFKEHLFDPFSKGIRHLNMIKQIVARDMKQLMKDMPDVRKVLRKTVEGTEYTHGDAIRVYNWDKAGFDIPGLSETDKNKLIAKVKNDPKLKAFADSVTEIATQTVDGIVEPGDHWLAGTIASDLSDSMESSRKSYLQEWIDNKNIIFSPENLNKIEAVYGSNFREALEDIMWRMEHGGTRSKNKDRLLSGWMTWLHGSIGTTMFFNARSAMLQMISNVNFINWGDNNMLAAAKAFANQPQYWKDVAMIFNSSFLKQRRAGLQTDVNAVELLNAMKNSKNKMKAATAYLLRLGFTPTQIADSLAIATGGATFYRNRTNTYISEGMSRVEAETKAFEDMMELAEETQQSAREDRISQQQASPLGKIVLAFQNTPMQYNRLIKKATMDLVNGRGDPKANVSRIVYYGAIQNMIFYGLQQALFAALFGDDEEDEITDKQKEKVLNGMMDTILRGAGIAGAVVATVKNVIIKAKQESDKMGDDNFFTDPDWGNVVIEALNISPPIGIKARKIHSSLKTWEYNSDVIDHMNKTDIDNPIYDAVFSGAEAITNVPLSRLYSKYQNIVEAMNDDHETWKRIAMVLGWSKWNFGIKNQDVMTAKGEVKEIKAAEAEERREIKKVEREAEKLAEEKAIMEGLLLEQEEEREQGQEDIKCAAVNKAGKRCGAVVKGEGNYCTIHESVPQVATEAQCSHVKDNGDQCKMKTKNQSGKCYYHD